MKPFVPPPISIKVQFLDGVEKRSNMSGRMLSREDVRRDAQMQEAVRRQAAMEKKKNLMFTGIAVVMFLLALLVVWTQPTLPKNLTSWFHAGDTTVVVVAPPVPAKPNGQYMATPLAQPGIAPQVPSPQATAPATMASAAAVSAAPGMTAAPILAPVAVTTVPAIKVEAHPIAVMPVAPVAKAPVKRAAAEPALPATPPPAQAAPPRREPLEIIDFFGTNIAVLLSSDGGQTMRSYRVGETLPSGEVIKVIDSSNGSVTTSQRIIKK